MTGFVQDVRLALLMLRARPAVFLGSVVALAIGIGASTAIFSVSATVLRLSPSAAARSPFALQSVPAPGKQPG